MTTDGEFTVTGGIQEDIAWLLDGDAEKGIQVLYKRLVCFLMASINTLWQ